MAEKLRNMTAVYLFREGKLLMLYRVGSRVVAPSWCGVGGHFEQAELNDPRACALRELREETGLTEESLEELRLRYITLRMKNGEIDPPQRYPHLFPAGVTLSGERAPSPALDFPMLGPPVVPAASRAYGLPR